MTILTALSCKCVVVLDPAELLRVPDPAPQPRVKFQLSLGKWKIEADINAKSIRKCQKTITEHGVDQVTVLIQGKLTDGRVVNEAGLVAQVKVAKGKDVDAAA